MFETRPDRDGEVVFVGRSNVGKSTLMREVTGHTFDTGQRPGVTRKPNHFDWTAEDFVVTDLPGFGFMKGVPEDVREQIKTDVVQYIERYAEHILVGVLVVDGKAVIDIIDRHSGPEVAASAAARERASGHADEVPHDVEMFHFLRELEIPTVVAVNKMDKVDDEDERLDDLCERLGLYPPWQQWQETIAPISAKRGNVEPLYEAIRHHLHEQERDDLFKFF